MVRVQELDAFDAPLPCVVDPRRRLRIFLAVFLTLLVVIFVRLLQLELIHGAAFRAEATKPLKRDRSLQGVRGRILASDGTVMAHDKRVFSLAVHYRYLEEPVDAQWCRSMARMRLSRAERADADRVMAQQARFQEERVELRRRLALLCGMSDDAWDRRSRRVQARVKRIAENANRRRAERAESELSSQDESALRREDLEAGTFFRRAISTVWETLRSSMDEGPPPRIVVAEELDYHVMAEGVPLEVLAEVESYPGQYPGVKILEQSRRTYPAGRMAANVLGYLGLPADGEARNQRSGTQDSRSETLRVADYVGRMGLEQHYESSLRGGRGTSVDIMDRSGQILSSCRQREPRTGCDVMLTLNPQLQRAAESLLDGALQRHHVVHPGKEPISGAIVVMEVRDGALRAAASAPRFEPGLFVAGNPDEVAALLQSDNHALVDRVSRMAIAPGSLFKTVSAVALLEAGVVDAHEPFVCRGYLHRPDEQRCAIYRRHGVGHGKIALADALAQSCNVYFFHYASQMGPAPLVEWASRFGLGRLTGIDLPSEVPGTLPTPATMREIEGHDWRLGDTQTLAVGQGSLTITPLQAVRMMGALANGGRLVTPHLVGRVIPRQPTADESNSEMADEAVRVPPPQSIVGLQHKTLLALREGLQRVVADPNGTAHGTVYLESIAIAGKTGTAETGVDRSEHAWFAGYAPADRPKYAFVVALEHAGDSAPTAGPVAKRLVLRMQELGML